MTYPPQQPRYAYAPAYGQQPPAQQQPQYGAPQGTPWLPQQYGGQPAPAVLTGGQAMPTAAPALGQSARTGGDGPKAPAPRHLVGRTVIFEPIRIDETTMQKNDKTGEMEVRPTAYYHLTVVDGGPLQYGDNKSQKPGEAHGYTLEVQTPARFTNVSSDRFGIVNEVRDAMACGEIARVGVVQQGSRGNYPFLVTKCARDLDGNDRPDGAERFERATLVWNNIFAKRFVSPEPRSLVAAPTSAPPQIQYQPQPAPTQFPQHIDTQGQGYGNGYQQPATQQAYGTQATYTPPQPSAPTQAVQQPAPPVNPAFEAYIASLPPEQQAAARAQFAPQPQAAYPGGPGF